MKPGARPTACYYASFLVVHRWYTAHTQHHSSAIRHTIIMHDDCCLSAAYPVELTLPLGQSTVEMLACPVHLGESNVEIMGSNPNAP